MTKREFAPWYVALSLLLGAALIALCINGFAQLSGYALVGGRTNSAQLIRSQSLYCVLPGIALLILGRYLWKKSRPETWRLEDHRSPVEKLISYRLVVYGALVAILVGVAMPWIYVKYEPVNQRFLGTDLWVGRAAFFVCMLTVAMLVFIDIFEGIGKYFYLCLIASGSVMMMVGCTLPAALITPDELVISTIITPPDYKFTENGHMIIPNGGYAEPENGFGFSMAMFTFLIALGILGPLFRSRVIWEKLRSLEEQVWNRN